MPRARDPFDVLDEKQRAALMRDTVKAVFGATMGDRLWKVMEPAVTDKRRQPGDAARPEDNYWKGHWRIHETD